MSFSLAQSGLKDTHPRRIVFDVLESLQKPASPYDLQRLLVARKSKVNIVTIYRVLAAFEEAHIVHKHPCNGHYSLCTLPGKNGHHSFLHCHSCGRVTEFVDERLCAIENAIAREAKFKPDSHMNEVGGVCSSCR